MSDETRVLNKDEKVGRKKYLKGLVVGFLGAAALLRLKDMPQASAVETHLKLGGNYFENDAGSAVTQLSSTGADTLRVRNVGTGARGAVKGTSEEFHGVAGYTVSSTSDKAGVFGQCWYGKNYGVYGRTVSNTSGTIGVYGYHDEPAGYGFGVKGRTKSTTGGSAGVYGVATESTGLTKGVYGITYSNASSAYGVHGQLYSTGTGAAVCGQAPSSKPAKGVKGSGWYGVYGETKSSDADAKGVYGYHSRSSGSGYGLYGRTRSTGGFALATHGRSKFGGHVFPTVDNAYDCGASVKRWRTVYSAGGVVTTSLSTFKENIEPPSDIDYLTSVPEPIYFNWKDGDDKEKRLGFMGDFLPEIAKDGNGGIYSSSVTAILCGAIKQIKQDYEEKIERLERRIEQLEKNN